MIEIKECLPKIGCVNEREFLGKPPGTLLLTKLHWDATSEATCTTTAEPTHNKDQVTVHMDIDRSVELTIHAEFVYNPHEWNQVTLHSGRTVRLYDIKHQPLYPSVEFSEKWKSTVRDYRTNEII